MEKRSLELFEGDCDCSQRGNDRHAYGRPVLSPGCVSFGLLGMLVLMPLFMLLPVYELSMPLLAFSEILTSPPEVELLRVDDAGGSHGDANFSLKA